MMAAARRSAVCHAAASLSRTRTRHTQHGHSEPCAALAIPFGYTGSAHTMPALSAVCDHPRVSLTQG